MKLSCNYYQLNINNISSATPVTKHRLRLTTSIISFRRYHSITFASQPLASTTKLNLSTQQQHHLYKIYFAFAERILPTNLQKLEKQPFHVTKLPT